MVQMMRAAISIIVSCMAARRSNRMRNRLKLCRHAKVRSTTPMGLA